jgi:ribose 5-phosphate isomerase B
MKIYLATDHAGFEMKESVKEYLIERGHEVIDLGAHEYDESDDYPDLIRPAAEAVAGEEGSFGIIFGGSGQGEAMVANRVPGVRCAVWYGGQGEVARVTREHNDANMLSLGARFMEVDEAKEAIDEFLGTEFSGDERHVRRIEKLR